MRQTMLNLVISTNAGKGIEKVVDDVYPGVKHRECMRHLMEEHEEEWV